jgi:hypothetical protein
LLQWLLLTAAVLVTVPLRLSLRIDIGVHPTFEVVLYVYGLRLQWDGRMNERGRLSLYQKQGERPLSLPFRRIVLLWYRLFHSAQFSSLEARCRLGTGDAASTALATGLVTAALRAVGSPFGAHVDVQPEYNRLFFALSLRCILSFRGGDIMVAGARAWLDKRPMMKKAVHASGEASH